MSLVTCCKKVNLKIINKNCIEDTPDFSRHDNHGRITFIKKMLNSECYYRYDKTNDKLVSTSILDTDPCVNTEVMLSDKRPKIGLHILLVVCLNETGNICCRNSILHLDR